jgi:hypothetical protein
MVVSEVVTLFFYIISIAFLPEYFGALPWLISYAFDSLRGSQIFLSLSLLDLPGRWQ